MSKYEVKADLPRVFYTSIPENVTDHKLKLTFRDHTESDIGERYLTMVIVTRGRRLGT